MAARFASNPVNNAGTSPAKPVVPSRPLSNKTTAPLRSISEHSSEVAGDVKDSNIAEDSKQVDEDVVLNYEEFDKFE
jgi:hypothetical protein